MSIFKTNRMFITGHIGCEKNITGRTYLSIVTNYFPPFLQAVTYQQNAKGFYFVQKTLYMDEKQRCVDVVLKY